MMDGPPEGCYSFIRPRPPDVGKVKSSHKRGVVAGDRCCIENCFRFRCAQLVQIVWVHPFVKCSSGVLSTVAQKQSRHFQGRADWETLRGSAIGRGGELLAKVKALRRNGDGAQPERARPGTHPLGVRCNRPTGDPTGATGGRRPGTHGLTNEGPGRTPGKRLIASAAGSHS